MHAANLMVGQPANLTRNPLAGHTICVDGPTASGKGTLAKELARRWRLKFLDTGTLYRAVAWQVLQHGADPAKHTAAEAAARQLVFEFKHLGNNTFGAFVGGMDVTEALRSPEVARNASIVAVQPAVRAALLTVQQAYVQQWQPLVGVVLDGRDTGVRIAPQASVKLFLTADAKARARRRWLEYTAKGQTITPEHVLMDLQARDARDAPNLLQAPDAVVLDATQLDAPAVLRAAVTAIEATLGPIPPAPMGA